MKKLVFNFSIINHPYPKENTSEFELWGLIKLIIAHDAESMNILNHQWDIIQVIEWLLEKKHSLLTEEFLFDCQKGQSIAECRDVLYSKDDFQDESEEESYYTKLDAYFSNHHFKLKGTDTPIFFIGIKNNTGEISWHNDRSNEYKQFAFDMKLFVAETQKEVKRLLQSWSNSEPRNKQQVLNRLSSLEKKHGVSLISQTYE